MDHLFIDFANTELFDGRGNRQDLLADAAARDEFLHRWALPNVDRRDLRKLQDLRSMIRAMAEQVGGGGRIDEVHRARLNEALARHPVRYRLGRSGSAPSLSVVPAEEGRASAIVGAIALSFATFVAEEEPDRLKMCRNDGCRWMFFDATKNRNRRWCRVCGNADRVRRFRERRRRERVR
jgi:predicted RNA-binding Zn ribbon-like protein